MGMIVSQSIRGSIWSYLGVIIGFITTSYLYPKYLTTDVVGLFGLLTSWAGLFSVFAALGFPGVTARLFPYFRNQEKGHNGYLFLILMMYLIGSIIFLIIFYWIRPWLVSSNLEKSTLFADYINLLIPFTLSVLLYIQLDIFVKVLYDAVYGIFATEFVQRVLILLVTVLFILQVFDTHQLIIAFVIANCIRGLMMLYYIVDRKQIHLKPNFKFISKSLRKEMWSVGVFSILASVGNSFIFNIDKIIINQIMGLSATGVYTIAFYFGVLVSIPSRALIRIGGTLIADAFRKQDLDFIEDIYHKSSLNQLIIGLLLFGGIVINIENILTILGPDYANGRWVIILIGAGHLVEMATGTNAQIIAYSQYFRTSLYFLMILIGLVIVNLFIFVPIWGLTGAAFAISLAILLNNLMRFSFVKYKFDMQPFTRKSGIVLLIFFLALGINYLIPSMDLIPDLIIRSGVFTLLFFGLVLRFNISSDINSIVRKYLKKYT